MDQVTLFLDLGSGYDKDHVNFGRKDLHCIYLFGITNLEEGIMYVIGSILLALSFVVLMLGGVNYLAAGTGETVLYLLISLVFATLGTGQVLASKLDDVIDALEKDNEEDEEE